MGSSMVVSWGRQSCLLILVYSNNRLAMRCIFRAFSV